MFINALNCLSIIQSYRLIWVSGKFGGGKTSFAYAIAEPFLQQGYRLITNNKSVWSDKLEDVKLNDDGMLKAVVILDEGGIYFESSRQIKQIASYANKMDCIFIIPSFFPPTKVAQLLTIQSLFSLKSAGVPIIAYKWRVDYGAFHDSGWFVWAFPQEIYGIYSRQDPASEPEEIIKYLGKRMSDFRKSHGHKDSISKLVEVKPEEIIADSIADLSSSLDTFGSSISRRKNKRFR